MNINELTDEEILNFLMTNDLDGDYSPSELKYLVSKWRYFYRLSLGRNEQNKLSLETKIIELTKKCEDLEFEKNELLVSNANKENQINSMKNRKLTLKERLTGKIITKNEN